jgi:phage terminase large subunit-like protein
LTRSSAPPAAPSTDGGIVGEFISSFCRLSKGDSAGQLIELRPWQQEILDGIFAVDENGRRKIRRALVMLPRKNAKSTLAAGIALFGLFQEVGAEVLLCAGDRQQARIVFRECSRMVELDPVLSKKLHVMRDVIEYPETGSVLRVLSSDGSRAEGTNPSLVVFDELHVQPDDKLWNAVNLGSGARKEPLVLAITTAGAKTDARGQDSLAYKLWQYGTRVESGEVKDAAFFFKYWHAPEALAWDSPEAWAAANPAFGDFLDPEDFAAAVRTIEPSSFQTKRLNRWVSTATSWLPTGAWERLATDRKIQPGEPCVLAFDGSFDGDSTAVVAATLDGHIEPLLLYERPIDDPKWRVDIGKVEQDILDLIRLKGYAVQELAADGFRWARSLENLEKEGLPVVLYPQSPSRMVAACQKFYEAVGQEEIHHGGDAVLEAALTRHLANSAVKTDRFGPRIVKEHRGSPRKIDLAVCAVMALDRARYYAGEADKPVQSVEFTTL